MRSLAQRDQAVIAIVGTIVAGALILFAVGINKLPLLHPKTGYSAELATSGGMKKGDDVRVSGISVGSVSSVRVEGDHVRVRFTVRKGLALGSESTASVEIATVLGELFLQIDSAGPGRLPGGATIPLARTTVPYTLLDAFVAFGENAAETDLPTLQKSLQQLSATLRGISPVQVRATLRGLTKIANALASRQDEIRTLLDDAQRIAHTLQTRGNALVSLLNDGDQFLQLLIERRDVISRLLHDTADLGSAVSTLIREDGAPLTSLLENVDALSGILAKDHQQLQHAIEALGQFSVNFANVSGNGPWIDILLPTLIIPDTVIGKCGVHPKRGCGG